MRLKQARRVAIALLWQGAPIQPARGPGSKGVIAAIPRLLHHRSLQGVMAMFSGWTARSCHPAPAYVCELRPRPSKS